MARELLRSVDGRQLPNLGEVAVYWPHQDYTDIFDTTGFSFDDEPSISGERDGDEYPELIEHDAEATALELLESLLQTVQSLDHWFVRHGDQEGCNSLMMQKARLAIKKATGSAA